MAVWTSSTAAVSFVLALNARVAFDAVPIVAFGIVLWLCAFVPIEMYRLRRYRLPLIRGSISLPATVGIVGAALLFANVLVPRITIDLGHQDIMGSDAAYRIDPFLATYALVFAPIFEEIIFQGWLQTNLMRFGALGTVLFTSILFTCAHIPDTKGQLEPAVRLWMVAFPTLLSFAVVRQTTKSLGAAVVCHAMANLFTMLQNAALFPR